MNRAPLACSRYTSTRRCGTSISPRATDHGVVPPSSCRYNSMLSIASPPLGDCATAYQLPRRPTPNPDGPKIIPTLEGNQAFLCKQLPKLFRHSDSVSESHRGEL